MEIGKHFKEEGSQKKKKSKKKNQKNYPEDTVFGGNSGHETEAGVQKTHICHVGEIDFCPHFERHTCGTEKVRRDTHSHNFFQWNGLGNGVKLWDIWVELPILHVCLSLE